MFLISIFDRKNAKNDFINQSRIILGGERPTAKVANLYNWRFDKKIPIIETIIKPELIKYMNNIFLATKVSFILDVFNCKCN